MPEYKIVRSNIMNGYFVRDSNDKPVGGLMFGTEGNIYNLWTHDGAVRDWMFATFQTMTELGWDNVSLGEMDLVLLKLMTERR